MFTLTQVINFLFIVLNTTLNMCVDVQIKLTFVKSAPTLPLGVGKGQPIVKYREHVDNS